MPSEEAMGPSHGNDFNEDKFRKSITGLRKFKSSCTRASSIKNLILQIAHKIFVCTLLGKNESHRKIIRAKLYILWGDDA